MDRGEARKSAEIKEMIGHQKPRTARLESCPICAARETKHFFTTPDRLHGTPGEFSYDLCGKCGTVFQNPMVIPEDLHLCYPPAYSPYNLQEEIPDVDFDALPNGNFRNDLRRAVVEEVKGKQDSTGLSGALGKLLAKRAFFRERAFYGLVTDELLPRGAADRWALDLGCGAGWLMKKLKKVGWETEGLEWNEAAAARAREATGDRVFAGDFRVVELPAGRYHLIVLNHVFEHLADLPGALRRIRELLADGGRAVLLYPNPHSFGAEWHTTDWFPWDAPRHLIFPTPQAVKTMAEEAGFAGAKVVTRAFYADEQWIGSKAYKNRLKPNEVRLKLNLIENLALFTEHFLTAVGFEKGWEIVAVLRK
jgi:SAM-dependent methyltransferase